jgi:hypothetical protein
MKRGRSSVENLPGDTDRYVDISVEISKPSLLGGSTEIGAAVLLYLRGNPPPILLIMPVLVSRVIWYKPRPVAAGKLITHIIDSVRFGSTFLHEYSTGVLRRKKWDGQDLILGHTVPVGKSATYLFIFSPLPLRFPHRYSIE